MRKNERFRYAMEQAGLVGQVEVDFKGWGSWHIDNADICLALEIAEDVSPVLVAITWMNETTMRFYSEPNTNDSDDVSHWDVGPMQTNRGVIQANVANWFLNAKGINLMTALASTNTMFIGDPLENLRLGARLLKRIGRGTITGPAETILYSKLTVEEWDALDDNVRNERRCVAYTGPLARPARYASWVKYAPLFTMFFKLYADV